jgi:hypothetical protein
MINATLAFGTHKDNGDQGEDTSGTPIKDEGDKK